MKIDVRGEVCPYPMMKAVEAMKQLEGRGEPVVVVTDHAPCLETIPLQAEWHGWDCAIEETGQPEWTLTLTPREKHVPA